MLYAIKTLKIRATFPTASLSDSSDQNFLMDRDFGMDTVKPFLISLASGTARFDKVFFPKALN